MGNLNKFYTFILKVVEPAVAVVCTWHLPFTHKEVTGVDFYKHRDKIKVGDVLLSFTKGEFGNLLNPEKLKHSALAIGYVDEIFYVLEATLNGVVMTDLVTFMTTKDVVVGCHPTFLDADDRANIPTFSRDLVGRPYDYQFNSGTEALYCFETVITVYKRLGYKDFRQTEVVRGKNIFGHATFYNDPKMFEITFDTRRD